MTETRVPSNLTISEQILNDIEKHAYSTLAVEVGGMLFGDIKGRKTTVVGFVPALKAASSQVSLTFTHEVWEEILSRGEKDFPGKQIVGWYHTHPSHGIFLSDYDLFIQQNFFSKPGQLALVIDPIAGRLGWFGAKGQQTALIQEAGTFLGPKNQKTSSKKTSFLQPQVLIATVVTLFVAVTATFALTRWVFPDGQAVTLKAQLKESGAEIRQLRDSVNMLQVENQNLVDQLGFKNGQLTMLYAVRPGDTWEGIATLFFQDKALTSQIFDYNPGVDAKTQPAVGQVITIVAPQGFAFAQPIAPEPTPTPSATPEPSKTPSPKPSSSKSAKS